MRSALIASFCFARFSIILRARIGVAATCGFHQRGVVGLVGLLRWNRPSPARVRHVQRILQDRPSRSVRGHAAAALRLRNGRHDREHRGRHHRHLESSSSSRLPPREWKCAERIRRCLGTLPQDCDISYGRAKTRATTSFGAQQLSHRPLAQSLKTAILTRPSGTPSTATNPSGTSGPHRAT